MNVKHDAGQAALDAQRLAKVLNRYHGSSRAREVLEILVTALPFVALWAIAWLSFAVGLWWLTLALAIPAAGFLVRLFMIQHDCSHGAFFPRRRENDWVGRVIGVLTLTPYDLWRRTHAMHHATSGNLDRRGMGDIDTLTVREYLARSRIGRLRYRVYRNPLVLFVLGPAYLFLVQQRIPVGLMHAGIRPWLSVMGTNAAILAVGAGLVWLMGLGTFLIVHLPMTLIAASAGVWLFYVQHQFEETTWSRSQDWNVHDAALHGSSHYDLPAVLRWFTGNIGIHHVHHLSSRIPFYRLPQVMRDFPELAGIGRITLMDSLRCVRLTLWDEDRSRLISFRDAGKVAAQGLSGAPVPAASA